MGELAEKSKDFYNLMAQHRALNESLGVTEAKVREEFLMIISESTRLKTELDRCEDLTSALTAVKARYVNISSYQQLLAELESIASIDESSSD